MAAIGILLLAGGLYSLMPPRMGGHRTLGKPTLLALGGVTGFVAALTGAGGAFVLLPIMLLLDMPVLPPIGLGHDHRAADRWAGQHREPACAGSLDIWLAGDAWRDPDLGHRDRHADRACLATRLLRRLLGSAVVHRRSRHASAHAPFSERKPRHMSSTTIRGADIVMRTLERAGHTTIFTLSGNHIMSLFDAAIDTRLGWSTSRHEAAAVHMADAWGRLTGEPGIAMVTGGPGHANAAAALMTAQGQESPLVLLSGHTETNQLGRGGFQELRQAEVAAPMAKASWTATATATLGADVAKAIRIARSGRPGPVHLSLPSDLLDATVAADTPSPGQTPDAFTAARSR